MDEVRQILLLLPHMILESNETEDIEKSLMLINIGKAYQKGASNENRSPNL
nr:MAG TPA: hypothetical protein [Bacteriophage sp.]